MHVSSEKDPVKTRVQGVYYQLYDLLSCKYHACNQRRTYVWIVQFWKHEFPLNTGYSSQEFYKEIWAWKAVEIG